VDPQPERAQARAPRPSRPNPQPASPAELGVEGLTDDGRRRPMSRALLLCGLVLFLAAALAGCEDGESNGDAGTAELTPEQGFLQAMVSHHASAIEMAKVAEDEAESSFVRRLADDITTSQSAEIEQMRRMHERLVGSQLKPDINGYRALGLSAEEAGLDHVDGAKRLKGKTPFDRVFVDEMIPHHDGAVRMAEAVRMKTGDPELRELAKDIVRGQKRELEEMYAFRERGFR
jgi:uncharacterized protein (DUF305 family)